MGGVKSKMSSTNWAEADGGIKEAKHTIDGAEPTKKSTTIQMVKKQNINDRDFTVFDETNTALYYTEVQKGTARWFHLTDLAGTKLFVAHSAPMAHEWTIYTLTPNWEGQEPDPKGSKEDKIEDVLYKKFFVNFGAFKEAGKISMFIESEDEKAGIEDTPTMVIQNVRAFGCKFQTAADKDAKNLIGYWDWGRKNGTHCMNVKLAANSDIALHAILSVLSNIVWTEQSGAGGAAGAGAC